jgi:hypothetical protein
VELSKFTVTTLLVLLALNLPTISANENELSIQVGARGDDASRGNLGVRTEIRTHLYRAIPAVLDYFWVGTILLNGAFVQFGYSFEPGYFCLKGSLLEGDSKCAGDFALLSDTDARWQWQYWPNAYGKDFYYEIGPMSSAGLNGTWHQYSIVAGSNHSVVFVLDQEQVAKMGFQLQPSEEPPMIVAEKVTASNELGDLGPVEFRNLEYLEEDGWHAVDSLVSLNSCGINTSCTVENAYGVSSEGPNQIIAGSRGEIRRSGQLLWTSGYVTLNITVHPKVQFHLVTIAGDQHLVGSAQARVPKGLFADVWLTTTSTQTDGLLGLMGAVDQFQGWTGYENLRNQSIRLLMDRNRSVQATWRTNLEPVAYTTSLALMFLVAILAWVALRLKKHSNKRTDYRRSNSV